METYEIDTPPGETLSMNMALYTMSQTATVDSHAWGQLSNHFVVDEVVAEGM